MKINEVEQRVGITKKNIRFYEDQGLITPARGSNGYRDYSEEDVVLLHKIRLLRRLAIPIEEIRNLLEGRLSLHDCMERHQIFLNHEKQNLNLVSTLCKELEEEEFDLVTLPAEAYLDKLNEIEKGGMRFLDVSKVDVGKEKRGATIAAIVVIAIVAVWDVGFLILNRFEPMPMGILLLMILPPILVVVGILFALRERMKEIEGGEAGEASNY